MADAVWAAALGGVWLEATERSFIHHYIIHFKGVPSCTRPCCASSAVTLCCCFHPACDVCATGALSSLHARGGVCDDKHCNQRYMFNSKYMNVGK